MGAKALSKKVAEEAVAVYVRCGRNQQKAANALGIGRGTMQNRLHVAATMYGIHVPEVSSTDVKTVDPETVPDELAVMRDRVTELESQIKASRANSLDEEYVKRKIIGLSESMSGVAPPPWVLQAPKRVDLPGVPSVMWSDWHWGETVFPAQINGVNAFNLEVAHKRARTLLEKTIYLLNNYEVRPEYPGIVVNLGGDMLSGDIHDELKESNDVPNMVALLDLFGVLTKMLETLADEYGQLFVPCVAGNHGRNTKKPQAKNRAFTNFDWLLYQFLAKRFENDARIRFFIPDGPDASYRVYSHRYLLTHGDQFRGGDGIIGALGPITRGHKKKQARNSAIDLGFDTMILGHWHQYIPMLDTIVNGSLKGYDEYAQSNNFNFQLPIQALWTTHHRLGINSMRPVYLEPRRVVGDSEEWVSWRTTS